MRSCGETLLDGKVLRRSLLDRAGRDEGRCRVALVPRLLRFLEHHVVSARRANRLALQAAQCPHIRHQLPDLIVRNLAAECGHSVWSPLCDGREDVLWVATVNPLVIRQWRPDPSAAVRMAAGAVHLVEESLALRHRVRVILVRIAHAGLNDSWSRLESAHQHRVRCSSCWRGLPEAPLLALAANERGYDKRSQKCSPCDSHVAGPSRPMSSVGTP